MTFKDNIKLDENSLNNEEALQWQKLIIKRNVSVGSNGIVGGCEWVGGGSVEPVIGLAT